MFFFAIMSLHLAILTFLNNSELRDIIAEYEVIIVRYKDIIVGYKVRMCYTVRYMLLSLRIASFYNSDFLTCKSDLY